MLTYAELLNALEDLLGPLLHASPKIPARLLGTGKIIICRASTASSPLT